MVFLVSVPPCPWGLPGGGTLFLCGVKPSPLIQWVARAVVGPHSNGLVSGTRLEILLIIVRILRCGRTQVDPQQGPKGSTVMVCSNQGGGLGELAARLRPFLYLRYICVWVDAAGLW